jgi:hypothetical protein
MAANTGFSPKSDKYVKSDQVNIFGSSTILLRATAEIRSVYIYLFIYLFIYSYYYVCSVLYILFSSCQLAFFGYPE